GRADGLAAVLVGPDGRIVTGGTADTGAAPGGTGNNFAVVRLTAAGALDPSFGTGGKALVDFAGDSDALGGLAFGPGGTIVAAGTASVPHADAVDQATEFNADF